MAADDSCFKYSFNFCCYSTFNFRWLSFIDAIGKPQVAAGINLIKLITLVLLVFPLTLKFGIIGTSWAVVIAQLAVYPWFAYKLKNAFK